MLKLINYIKNGKGIGAIWLLILGAVLAFYTAFKVNKSLPLAIPYVQDLADEFLPIKIEDGKIVDPVETIKKHEYQLGKDHLTLTLDTTKDVLEEQDMMQGIYVTRSYIYTINGKEVRRQALQGSYNIEKRDYTPLLQKIVNWVVWGIALIGPFFNFVLFLIAVLIYAFCTGLACVLNKVSLDFKRKMRLNTVLFIGLYTLVTILQYAGLQISTFTFFLIMIALQLLLVKKAAD